MNLYRISSKRFTAGLVVDNETGIVVEAAPILRWTIGQPWLEVVHRFLRAEMEIEFIN
jgi:hypothetical protein